MKLTRARRYNFPYYRGFQNNRACYQVKIVEQPHVDMMTVQSQFRIPTVARRERQPLAFSRCAESL
jgi:hypothetical protein